MAPGYVPAELAADGIELEGEIIGEMFPPKIVGPPPYDPSVPLLRRNTEWAGICQNPDKLAVNRDGNGRTEAQRPQIT